MDIITVNWTQTPLFVPVAIDLYNYRHLSDYHPKWEELYYLHSDVSLSIESDECLLKIDFKKGFCYDRASVPFALFSIRRDRPDCCLASLVHDVCYNVKNEVPNEYAQELLWSLMRWQGASRFVAFKYYLATTLASPFLYSRIFEWDVYISRFVTVDFTLTESI
jgi:hypothetical protein